MKKKFIIFALCFTLIFSSFNYRRSYADGGVVSLPILATVSALAVGSNILINSNDDLYDLGNMFYNYVKDSNDLTWDAVQLAFSSAVSVQPNKLVSVKSDFLDIVKDFFDTFTGTKEDSLVSFYSIELDKYYTIPSAFFNSTDSTKVLFADSPGYVLSGSSKIEFDRVMFDISQSRSTVRMYVDGEELSVYSSSTLVNGNSPSSYRLNSSSDGGYTLTLKNSTSTTRTTNKFYFYNDLVGSFPYQGDYTWENVDNKIENDSVSLPIPGDLSSLVGQTSDKFWDNTDNLVGNGNLSIPGVSNPSVSLGGSTTFPNVGEDAVSPSVPSDGIWANIKSFIISLVVPSDTFWTDTWGGLYNNFTGSFPMVDMDNFNKLVTGEKKFPNIDIDIMGVSGRVVNGDVINSIVDWLRPIVAGFMMLCLMLFNYRKIYKLIRNSEPFGSIASGNNSDIKSGISEYSKHEVVKATDMVSEYHAWKERGGK